MVQHICSLHYCYLVFLPGQPYIYCCEVSDGTYYITVTSTVAAGHQLLWEWVIITTVVSQRTLTMWELWHFAINTTQLGGVDNGVPQLSQT